MSTAAVPEAKLQIGHVLFIDIVGYSKLLVNEQEMAVRQLNEVVQSTEEFRISGRKNKLLRIPTGDGMALVFRDSPESPVRCALDISGRLRKQTVPLRVRMGIHSGLVQSIADVNNRLNVAGAGINFAQRVMDCGDAGHILLSKHVAEDLEHHARWRPFLHDLGQCEVKHGVKLGIVNLYDSEAGNPSLPNSVRRSRMKRRTGSLFLFTSSAALSLTIALGTWYGVSRYSKNEALEQPRAEIGAPVMSPTPQPNLIEPSLAVAQPDSSVWPAYSPAPQFSPSQKLFAGNWHGTIRTAGPKGSKTSKIEFTIDETETHWSNMGPGTSSRHGRTLAYSRSYRLGATNVRQTAELTINADGGTANYRTNQTSVTGKVRSVTSGFGTLQKTD